MVTTSKEDDTNSIEKAKMEANNNANGNKHNTDSEGGEKVLTKISHPRDPSFSVYEISAYGSELIGTKWELSQI